MTQPGCWRSNSACAARWKRTPTVAAGLLRFAYLVVGGLGVGVVVAAAVDWLERRIDDGPIEIAISLMVPYAAYLGAEAIHASGVLAVVACGLLLSRRSAEFFSPSVRLQIYAVWSAIVFILNGVVFVVIGLQLSGIVRSLSGVSLPRLVIQGALFSALVVGAAARVADARRPPLVFHPPSFPASDRCAARRRASCWCSAGAACAASSRWRRRGRSR